MLYELSRDVEELLRARLYPVTCLHGPERPGRGGQHHSLVMVFERASGDRFDAPRGFTVNPRKVATRQLACQVTIYAKSNLPGAHRGDHERLCEQLIDALTVTLDNWADRQRAVGLAVTGGAYLTAADRDDVEGWTGVVYALRFNLPRGVMARDFNGEARPEASLSGFSNSTQVTLTGSDADPVTGCGG